MIKYQIGSLTDIDYGYVCQQVNCRNAYGAGISGAIAEKHPEVEAAYHGLCERIKNPDDLFGHAQEVGLDEDFFCVNIFSQKDYGNSAVTGKVYTDMKALVGCLTAIADQARHEGLPMYIPYRIGCGLAGGKWDDLTAALDPLNERFTVMVLPEEEGNVKDNLDGYLLVSVCDHEILTQRFGTLKCAQDVMRKEMVVTGAVKEDDFFTSDGKPLEEDEYYDLFAFHPYGGYANADDCCHDWHIAPL